MFCRNCGKQLIEGSRFCENCGAPTGLTEARPNPQQQSQNPQQPPRTYQQPAQTYQQPQASYSAPRKKKPSAVAKILIGLVIVALVIPAIVFVSAFFSEKDKTTLAEQHMGWNWNYVEISQYDGTYVIREAHTLDEDCVDEVWTEITQLELRSSGKDFSEEILDQPYIDMFLMTEQANRSFEVVVTEDGDLCVYIDGESWCYTGAAEIYSALKLYLPGGDTISLDACIPETGWSSLGIYFYGADGESVDSGFTMEPDEIKSVIQRLGTMDVSYGGGTYYGFDGSSAQLFLMSEDGESTYAIYVFEDGNAEVPIRDWVYGVYDAVDLYNVLWAMMMELK